MALFDPRWRLRLLSLYPAYLGAGVRVRASADLRTFDVRMKLRWWNRNYVGTQFGGSLYSMCDPFFMLILFEHLGRDYIVWDKSAAIEFVEATKAPVFAEFVLDDATLDEIRSATAGGEKYLRWFETEVRTADGQVVARVRKELYVRRKREA